jgi:hypothetical protein
MEDHQLVYEAFRKHVNILDILGAPESGQASLVGGDSGSDGVLGGHLYENGGRGMRNAG